MKTLTAFFRAASAPILSLFAALVLVPAQARESTDPIILEPDDPPSPVLVARDVTQDSPGHEVKLVFPSWPGIDRTSLGNGDIVATGPSGVAIPAEFVAAAHEERPFPQPLESLPGEADDVAVIPEPVPVLVATYRFPGPGGGWNPADNGVYRVKLMENQILTDEGRALPASYLGGFRCAIERTPLTIQPEDLDIRFRRVSVPVSDAAHPAGTEVIQYAADVTMTFNTPHVRIDWGTVERTPGGFVARIRAWKQPVPVPAPAVLQAADEVARVNAGEILPVSPDAATAVPRFRHTYRLGVLAPGTYGFMAMVNGIEEGRAQLVVPVIPPVDDEAPEAELRVRNVVRANGNPQRMAVTYSDLSGVNLRTLGHGDIAVYSPCLYHPAVNTAGSSTTPVCSWRAQRARLVEVEPLNDDLTKVRAIYEIEPPRGGWTAANNGFYPVVLLEDEVCDRPGNCNRRERLGGFHVSIDDTVPPIPARAEITVDADPRHVMAKVHVAFDGYYRVTSQSVRRDGNRVYLLAHAEPYFVPAVEPMPPFPQQDLRYEIGTLRRGDYVAAFIMNRHLYDREAFSVPGIPPISADVSLAVDASNAAEVVARVTIQFRTPHRVVQGSVVRNGARILLPAKAEPLPVPLDIDAVIPVPAPVVLTYRIGALPPGGYLAVFEMNEHPYDVERFTVDAPQPPIPADVAMRIDLSEPDNTVAVVKIAFRTPHIITGRDLHRRGNHFVLEATARPVNPAVDSLESIVPVPQTIVLRYPLGNLNPGSYTAAFVMNGWQYARDAWDEPPFEADVRLSAEQRDDGVWLAHAKVKFDDPRVRITSPGTPVFNGPVIMINATAAIIPPHDGVEPVDPAPATYEFTWELGRLATGPYWLKYFINGVMEQQLDFSVPPIPARVELSVAPGQQPVIATARIQFRDHYRITQQSIVRFGNLIFLVAQADGPLPLGAPIPPPPTTLTYNLGQLRTGPYVAVFVMNNHIYDHEFFKVTEGPWEAEVDLAAQVSREGVMLKATVDIDDPYVIITDPGTPVISGRDIRIKAVASRVTFIQPPSGDPQTFRYDLGRLPAGDYTVVYSINSTPEARLHFRVPVYCDPLPNVMDIRIGNEPHISPDGSLLEGSVWYSRVTLALLPGQQVTDWGVVRQEENGFHVNVTVECVDYPDPPVPVDPVPAGTPLPAGVVADPVDGRPVIGGVPVRLVSHTYRLGRLAEGFYKFCVHSRGQMLACKRFDVEGRPPRVALEITHVTQPAEEHRFSISFRDPTGLDHTSIQDAKVWIRGRDNLLLQARLLSYVSTDDNPSTQGTGRYAVTGPGGNWDFADNGRYGVFIEAAKVRDLNGNHLADPFLGRFHVRIVPPPEPGVDITMSMSPEGNWGARVVITSEPGQQVVVDSWGPLVVHGQSFIALASVHLQPVTGPVVPVSHTYNLGPLQPGYYVFVFKSNLAHCGIEPFNVAGEEGPLLERFMANAGVPNGGDDEDLNRYFFALPDENSQPDVRAEIVTGADGRKHLGMRFRRLTAADGVRQRVRASADLRTWTDVSDRVRVVERTVDVDGTEEVVLCLEDSLDENSRGFLDLRLEREE